MKTFKYHDLTNQAKLMARLGLFDLMRDPNIFDVAKPLSVTIESLEVLCLSWEFKINGEVICD